MTLERLPMFPLPMPLLPGMGLPLQVFETRYHVMMEDVMGGDDGPGGRFGVALITRGHQVGGGDLRAQVGTVAEVLRHQQLDDGRRLVLAVGRERIRIRRWLRDDPYPVAEVETWPDASGSSTPGRDSGGGPGPDPGAGSGQDSGRDSGAGSGADSGPDMGASEPIDPAAPSRLGRIDIQGRLDDIVELVAARLDDADRDQLFESSNLPRDLDLAIWQATIVADLGALDRQRLLECPGRRERLPVLVDMLEERRDVLAFTLDDHDGGA